MTSEITICEITTTRKNQSDDDYTQYAGSHPLDITMEQRISSLRRSTFGRSNPDFVRAYEEWHLLRERSIRKLKNLNETLSDVQKTVDRGKIACKWGSLSGRAVKPKAFLPNFAFYKDRAALFVKVIEVIASLVAAIATFIEAIKADNALATCKRVMQKDAAATSHLHAARSRCMSEYHDVTEVSGGCNAMTFSETCSSIFDALGFSNDCKNPSLSSIIKNFNENWNSATMHKIIELLNAYKRVNPAVGDVIFAVGRFIFGIIDTFLAFSKASESRGHEINLFQKVCDEIGCHEKQYASDSYTRKLITEALESLENEMEEMDSMIGEIIVEM